MMEQRMRLPLFGLLILGACQGDTAPEDCWYCEDGVTQGTGSGNTDDGKTSDGKTGDGKTGTGTKTGTVPTLHGEVDANTGLGWIYLEGADCLSTFDVAEAAVLDTCPDCTFAFALTIGEQQASADSCANTEAYQGVPLEVGHQEPDEFWSNKDGWTAITTGYSTVAGENWDFGYGS